MEVSALKPSAVPDLRGPSPLLRLQSDERLIALVRRGQHTAFEVLVSRYQARLLAFCRHMLGSREDAEDVLQEVFAAAFNAILADDRTINVRPWLYRIARNRSLNHLRRASAIGVDSMDTHYAESGLSTAEKVLRRESFRQLIGDVHRLPETQRTALLLREIDALSYEQISDAMETTVPAVKSLLVRARISLAEAAEARKLTCEEARIELGEAAEGLVKITPAVRRHTRECDRCRAFRKHLKDNNVALAAMLPVGPLLLLKKLAITKLGSTAGAGGAHVAGAGGAAAGAAGAGGASATSGLVTAGASALASKAAAGLAVAALVTAGTVEAEHATSRPHAHHHASEVASTASPLHDSAPAEPVVTRSVSQPMTVVTHTRVPLRPAGPSAARKSKHQAAPPKPNDPPPVAPATSQAALPAGTPTKGPGVTKPGEPTVEQVTSETTQLAPTAGNAGMDGGAPATPPAASLPASTPATTPSAAPTPTPAPTTPQPPPVASTPEPPPPAASPESTSPPSAVEDPNVKNGHTADPEQGPAHTPPSTSSGLSQS